MFPELEPHLRIERLLGRGGGGSVFEAIDLRNDSPVAVKVLDSSATGDCSNEQFTEEFRISASLHHPGLIRLFDFSFSREGHPYFTMELIRGSNLDEAAAANRSWLFPIQSAASVCAVLSFLHKRGHVHGDLKPQHIILVEPDAPYGWPPESDTGLPKVVLIDLGLSGSLEMAPPPSTSRLTGTPFFISPEVIVGNPPTIRSDLYTLGVMLYTLYSGHHPFTGDDIRQLLWSHLHSFPDPLQFEEGGAPPRSLERLIFKLLSRNPGQRHSSADELHASLIQIIHAHTPSGSGSAGRGRRNKEQQPTTNETGGFVGRRRSMARLIDCLELATAYPAPSPSHSGAPPTAGTGPNGQLGLLPTAKRLVLLTGSKGIGTSRLLEEFRLECRLRGVSWYQVRCHPHGGHALAPLRDLHLMATASLKERDGSPEEQPGQAFEALWPPDGDVPLPRLEQALEDQERIFSTLIQEVATVAGGKPMALFVEDIHWAEEAVVEFLGRLASVAHRHRILVGGTCLSEALDLKNGKGTGGSQAATDRIRELASRGATTVIELKPLGSNELSDLIRGIDFESRLDPDLVSTIVSEAAGNPAVAGETTRHLLDELDSETSGTLSPIRDSSHGLLHQAFSRKLHGLTPQARKLLDVLALCPLPLSSDALNRVTTDGNHRGEDPPDEQHSAELDTLEDDAIPVLLSDLIGLGLVTEQTLTPRKQRRKHSARNGPAGKFFSLRSRLFKHDLRQRLADDACGAYHRKLAESLIEDQVAGQSEEPQFPVPDDVICHHLERAVPPFDSQFVARHLILAGLRAKRAHSPIRAARLLEAALTRMEMHPEAEAASLQRQMVLDNLGDIYTLTGRYGNAETAFQEALDLGSGHLESSVIAGLERKIGLASASCGNVGKALRHLETARTLVTALDRPEEYARVLDALGTVLQMKGDYTLAVNLLLEGSRDADPERKKESAGSGDGPVPLQADGALQGDLQHLYGTLGRVFQLKGDMESAIKFLHKGATLNTGSPEETAAVLSRLDNMGQALALSRDFEAAETRYLQSLELKTQRENMPGMAETLHSLGELHTEWGKQDEALDDLHKALAIWRDLSRDLETERTLAALGALHVRRHEYVTAVETLKEATDKQLQAGRVRHAASRLNRLSLAQFMLGQYRASLRNAETAIHIQTSRRRESHVLSSAELKAVVFLELGLWDECGTELEHLRQRQGSGQEFDLHRARALGIEAERLISLNRIEEAAEPARESIRLFRGLELEDRPRALGCRLLFRLHNRSPLPSWWPSLFSESTLSPPPEEKTPAQAEEALASGLIAARSEEAVPRDKALALFRRGLEAAGRLQLPEIHWRSLLEISRELSRRGQIGGQLEHLKQAVQVLRHISGMIDDPVLRRSYLNSHQRNLVFGEIERLGSC